MDKIDNTPNDKCWAENLSKNLRLALNKNKVSISELSNKSNVSTASISRILNGQTSPSLSNISKIANALNMSLDELTLTSTPSEIKPKISTVDCISDNEFAKIFTQQQASYNNETNILANFIIKGRTAGQVTRELLNNANGTWSSSWTDSLTDNQSTQLKVKPIIAKEINESNPDNNQGIDTDSDFNEDNFNQEKTFSVSLSFPQEIVEESSITSLISVISSTLVNSNAIIQDIKIPNSLIRTFSSPSFGIKGIRDKFCKYGRPLLSATVRPMHGLSPKMYGRVIYESLRGGIDIACDPTMMQSLANNNWKQRFSFGAEATREAEIITKENKLYIPNVTASDIEDIIERIDYAESLGLSAVLVDSATIGWSALCSLAKYCRENEVILCAMGHRSLQSSSMSEQLIAKLLRLIGCDIVSIGSPINVSTDNRQQVNGVIHNLKDNHQHSDKQQGIIFNQHLAAINEVLPACGGGHNPWHYPRLIDAMGSDCIIQCGSSIIGHPMGSTAGATASRVAIEAIMLAKGEGRNISVHGNSILQEASKDNKELKVALEFWKNDASQFGIINNTANDKITSIDEANSNEYSSSDKSKTTKDFVIAEVSRHKSDSANNLDANIIKED